MILEKAVILAAGLGTRMQDSTSEKGLRRDQLRMAERGLKTLIAFQRPFLDYLLAGLREAGIGQVCLVVPPRHDEFHRLYVERSLNGLNIVLTVQERPMGTADALLAAEGFAADEPFLALNSDNLYPGSVLSAMRNTGECAVTGFEKESLLSGSNLTPERICDFAVLESKDGFLTGIVEKPDSDLVDRMPRPVLVSMNCWRFDRSIFRACRSIPLSKRGEYELPDAVLYSIGSLGTRFRVIPSSEGVLDLSSRADVARIADRLTT